jgi:lipopolysaccharide transport system ATP-binding protein
MVDTRSPGVIVVHKLGKRFRRYHTDRPRTLKEAFVRGLRRMGSADEFWALRDVSFSVAPGSMVGVIGRNGAGKSTLLRLIGGVGKPNEGSVKVRGRINAFLDLTAGFRPDLTGRENIMVGGVIAGLTRREIKQRFDAIVEFAELEEFIDSPLRAYSTGMRMRLAFSVAAHTEPDVLLIDEVLAVGDLAFRRKCFERIEAFRSRGCTIVLVSHDVNQIQRLCDEALWLRKGRLMAYGDPEEVTGRYVTEMMAETRQRTPPKPVDPDSPTNGKLQLGKNRLGSQELKIVDVQLLNQNGIPVTELDSGDPLCIQIEYLAPEPIVAPIFGVGIVREDHREACCNTSTDAAGLTLPTLHGRGHITLQFERLDLVGGQYFINVGVYEQEWGYAYDLHVRAYSVVIRRTPGKKGILRPPHRWEMGKISVSNAEMT